MPSMNEPNTPDDNGESRAHREDSRDEEIGYDSKRLFSTMRPHSLGFTNRLYDNAICRSVTLYGFKEAVIDAAYSQEDPEYERNDTSCRELSAFFSGGIDYPIHAGFLLIHLNPLPT